MLDRQNNRERIARVAIEHLERQTTANPSEDAESPIDDDWLNTFNRIAGEKSVSDIQELWGRILAGKIRRPSSFGLSSLNQLAAFDSADAAATHDVLSYTINNDFIYAHEFTDITRFVEAEDRGVLNGTSGSLRRTLKLNLPPNRWISPLPPLNFTLPKRIFRVHTSNGEIRVPSYNLTRFGKDLLKVAENLNSNPDYEEAFGNFLKGFGKVQTLNKSCVPPDTVFRDY